MSETYDSYLHSHKFYAFLSNRKRNMNLTNAPPPTKIKVVSGFIRFVRILHFLKILFSNSDMSLNSLKGVTGNEW